MKPLATWDVVEGKLRWHAQPTSRPQRYRVCLRAGNRQAAVNVERDIIAKAKIALGDLIQQAVLPQINEVLAEARALMCDAISDLENCVDDLLTVMECSFEVYQWR